MKHIIVYYDGGLGNQMSQYAMSKLLQKLYPNKKILSNIDVYKNKKIHNGFEINNIFRNIDINRCSKFYSLIGRNDEQIIQQYESGYPMDMKIFHLEDKSYRFYGTWHNYDYSSILPDLRNDFCFRKLPPELLSLGERITGCNSVAIHVRKGDYIQYGLDILTIDWYKKAIEIIKSKVYNPVFFLFSDGDVKSEFDYVAGDINYVTGNSGENAYIDMQLMSMCKHNIIANSTFSYWAAMLNSNPNKIVIRPTMQTKDNKTWPVNGWILLD